MNFFTDIALISSDAKVGITSLFSNITSKPHSHKGGWTRLLKCQLKHVGIDATILNNKDSILNYDIIILDQGAEFKGVLNLFGGVDDKFNKRFKEWQQFILDGRQLFSWKNEIPDFSNMLLARRTNNSTCEKFKLHEPEHIMSVCSFFDQALVFSHVYKTNKLLIGDSHTPSVWTPDYMIEREDGRTLFGMLKKSTITEYLDICKILGIEITDLMIHASSIDIRHHLARQPNPKKSTVELANALFNSLVATTNFYNINKLTIVDTMGIEDESRDLPKTGYYKGTPFYGSWETRNELRNVFNEMLVAHQQILGWEIINFPEYFFDDSQKLRFDVMEQPGSVHLSPEHYRTNLSTGDMRWTDSHNVNMKTKFFVKNMSSNIEKAMYEP